MGNLDALLQKDLKSNTAVGKDEPASSPKAEKTWDKLFQPIIDETNNDKFINYSNSLTMMKAINGRYDSFLYKKDIDPKVKAYIHGLKKNSWDAMNEFAKVKTGNVDQNKFFALRNNVAKYENLLQTAIGPNQKKGYVFGDDKMIYDRKTYQKKDQTGRYYDDTTEGTTETNAGGGGVNPMAGYVQLKGYKTSMMNEIKNKISPIVSSWTGSTLNLLNSDDPKGKRIDPDEKQRAYMITKDVLLFTKKYGTVTGDKEADNKNKVLANKIFNELTSAKEMSDKYEVLKKYSRGEENQIQGLSQNLGYYGSTYVFNRYKDKLDNRKYYKYAPNQADQIPEINSTINLFNEHLTTETKWREKAYEKVLTMSKMPAKDYVFQSLMARDQKGNLTIADFDTWKKNLKTIKDPNAGKTLETGWGGMKSHGATMNVLNEVIEKNKSGFMSWFGQAWGADGGEQNWSGGHDYNKVARNVYNKAVKEYKSKFSEIKDVQFFKGAVQVKQIGSDATRNFAYDSADLTLDKNGYLVNTEGVKGSTVNGIFNLMKKGDGSINMNDVTLLSDKDTKANLFRNASKSKLDEKKDSNEDVYNEFFKDKKNDDVEVTYIKHSSIPNTAVYKFKNNTTGKTMSMVAPYAYLYKNNERIHKALRVSNSEYQFQLAGKRKLPDLDGVYKNAVIYEKNGVKVASFKFKNDDNEEQDFEYPLGDVDIKTATKSFNNFINNLANINNSQYGNK